MYLGTSPFSALYTSSRTLNWMRNLIGSQWSLMRTGVICSYFLVFDTILAALFCSRCSIAIKSCCIPTAALQKSKRDITSDCITVFCGFFCLHTSRFSNISQVKARFFTNTFDMGCHDQSRVKHSSQIPHRLRCNGHISPRYREWLNV